MAEPQRLISFCMIVRNEERYLPDCLESVQGVVDEMIIVDTGSTDRTVAIAESYGARVIHHSWEHDFSKARNAALEYATGEWILFLDADEQLDAATKLELREYAGHRELSALLMPIWNVVGEGEGQGATIHPVLRMFRNDAKHRFEGRIHEQIAASITRNTPNARFHLTDVIIHHYGYRNQVVAEKNKLQRNMDLLQLAIAEEPENSFHRYNIGVEYLRIGDPERALESFRLTKGAAGFELLSYAHLVVKYESLSLQMLRRWGEAAEAAARGIDRYPDYTDLWHYKALSHAHDGQLNEARAAAEKALELGASPVHYHTEDGMGTYRTAYLLGRIYEALQDEQGVLGAYIQALRYKPSLLPPLFRLCKYMKAAGQVERLPGLLATRIACSDEGAALKLAGVMAASGCYEAAVSWMEWQTELQKNTDRKQKLLDSLGRLRKGDYSELPQVGAVLQGNGASASEEWRTRADQFLAAMQWERNTVMEKRAITAVRILLPSMEGW